MGFFKFVEQVIFFPFSQHPVIETIITLLVFYALLRIVWALRLYTIKFKYILSKKWITLEIRIPKEIERSPAAMEIFIINALYQSGGAGNPYKKYWLGKVLNWVSLELCSFGGSVHFFIRCHSWMKDVIEAQLYAQFPQVEVLEVEDYTDRIPPYRADADWDMYGATYKQEMPDVYPIKTYKDWGVDRHYESLEVEQQIDPLSSIIEAMASLRKGEEWWIQIILEANKGDEWPKHADHEIKRLKQMFSEQSALSPEGRLLSSLTEGERETINAIERSKEKFRFNVGIRTIYLAKKEAYNGTRHLYIKNAFSPFATQHLNRLKRVTYTGFDNPWDDYADFLNIRKKERLLEDYREREYFDLLFKFTWFDIYMKFIDPHNFHHMVMTTEEIATIYHLPGRLIQTPGIERIESRTAEPPANLPV